MGHNEVSMMDDERGRGGKRFWLKVWGGILAVVVVLAVLVTLHLSAGRTNLEHRLEALRGAGCPTSFAELAGHNRVPEGLPNAADVYTRAFAAFVPPAEKGRTSFWGTADLPERGAPLLEPIAGLMSECAAANEQCLTLLHEAAGIQHCRYEWDYRQTPPDLVVVGDCARLLQMNALLQAHRGQIEEAVASVEDGLRLGESFQTRPWLISYIARSHYDTVALAGLERVLSVAALMDRQLEGLSRKVATIADTLSSVDAMITERCIMLENCRNLFSAQGSGSRSLLLRVPGARERTLADVLDWTDACIEAARLPDKQRVARFRQICRELEGLSVLHAIVKVLVPGMPQIAARDLVFRARLALVRTALAVERYRLARRGLPNDLEDLVPEYLKHVPPDPFDGRPIHYQPGTPGFLLYSVGEDGHDDGGRERDSVNKTGPCDLCFIVTR